MWFHMKGKHMKTLMISTALALALGLSGGAIALPQVTSSLVKAPALEITLQAETSLEHATDFYQGDYLLGARTSLISLTESDLYTGQGGAAVTAMRWVTH